ncbi:MAG: DNA replication/repair protein RecF [Johnsonella sp.]|nr:DNA replication/repair protein RecF [Johnsonella sp.]
MIIKSLELKNYRNYSDLSIELSNGINLFYGDNAQGKTNILESLYMAATARSHRGSKDRDIIAFGEEEAHIKVTVEKRGSIFRIDMHIKKHKAKGIAINSVPIRKASELFGSVNIVFFSPEDLGIIKKGPAERRKFMDFELCQLDKVYLNALINYNKILIHRNKLLKELAFRSDWKETLDIWDMQLLRFGKEMIRGREEFIKTLNPIIFKIHDELTKGREKIRIRYEKNTEADSFETLLRNSRESDIKTKISNIGPHRDDISFIIEDEKNSPIDLKTYGSQGQQRTAALSLKLAEIEMIQKITGDLPVLLLDDVLSELDHKRQEALISSIRHLQTMITCTGVEDYISKNFDLDKIIRVRDGKIYPESFS